MRVLLARAQASLLANVLLAFVATAAFCDCAAGASIYLDPLFGIKKTSAVTYGSGVSKGAAIPLVADIYEPVGIGLASIPSNRPAVVLQDGVAWTSALRQPVVAACGKWGEEPSPAR